MVKSPSSRRPHRRRRLSQEGSPNVAGALPRNVPFLYIPRGVPIPQIRSRGLLSIPSVSVCEGILATLDHELASRLCHPREGGGPGTYRNCLDSRLRGNDIGGWQRQSETPLADGSPLRYRQSLRPCRCHPAVDLTDQPGALHNHGIPVLGKKRFISGMDGVEWCPKGGCVGRTICGIARDKQAGREPQRREKQQW
jgi:hypothetical protein